MKSLTLAPNEPTRLDVLLAETLGLSRTKIQKAIKTGLIMVPGVEITPHFSIEKPTEVSYDEEALLKPIPRSTELPVLDIIFEDADILVINKQAGFIVHRNNEADLLSIADAAVKHAPEMASVGENPLRPGIVSRLDKGVSGVMVMAKNETSYKWLKRAFHDREVKKEYLALVHGVPGHLEGTIDFSIARSVSSGKMAARPNSQEGREAITHYVVKKAFRFHALLDLIIETGRTHQIRAHMLAFGHGIVGDQLYKPKNIKHTLPLNRPFLHSASLTIPMLDGTTKTFTAPLPPELQSLLDTLV